MKIILYAIFFSICFVSAENCDKCDCSQGKYFYNCFCFKERNNNCLQKDISQLFNVVYNKIEEIIIRDISITLNFTKNLTKLKKITLNSCNLNIIDKNSFNNMDRLTELTIENNEIKIVADDAFEYHNKLLYLDMKNNSLHEFSDKILTNLPELLYFNLGFNKINEISSKLFINSKQLQRIYLNRNKIVNLPNDIFEGLTQLKEIDLAQNKIEELPDGIFSDLLELEIIYLQNNELTSIKAGTFENSLQIKKIHLEGNKIQHLDWNILNLRQLTYLNIPDSSIKCDCKAKQYINIYKERKITGDILCTNNKKISDMPFEDFACEPKILNCVEVKENTSTKLSCLINGDPLPETIWRFNGSELFNNTLYNLKFEYVSQDIFWTNLTIFKRTKNSSGLYEIEARNNGGHTNYNYPLKIIAEPEDNMPQSTSSIGLVAGISVGVIFVVGAAIAFFIYRRKGHDHLPVETEKNNQSLVNVVISKPTNKSIYTSTPVSAHEKAVLEKYGLLEVIEKSSEKNRDSWCSIGSDDSL